MAQGNDDKMAKRYDDEFMKLYHYTTKDNAKTIRQQGVIQPSAKGAYGGNKVYLTSMDPSFGKAAIACNNYDGVNCITGMQRMAAGAVDDHITVLEPESKVCKVEDPKGRDIYTIEGPVHLPDEQDKSGGCLLCCQLL